MSSLLKFKKLLVSVLLAAVILPSAVSPVRAFSSSPHFSYPFEYWNAVYNTEEMNLQSFVNESLKAVMWSVLTPIIGCWGCEGGPYEDQYLGSALNTMGQLFIALYNNPPASGISYLAHLGNKLKLAPEVYAQDTGWQHMSPFMNIWKAFRDISYLFFVVILIIMGFMIMFRVKISPQAVITIQSSLPRVILLLILITFSYAIVGFMVDLMYVLINLAMTIFNQLDPSVGDILFGAPANPPITEDWRIFGSIFVVGALPATVGLGIVLMISAIPMIIVAIASAGTLTLLGGIAIFIVPILGAIVLLIALIRVIWILLKAYATVALLLVFSPFILLSGVLPSKNNPVGTWFKNLLANLAVFPTVLIMVYLSAYLILKTISDLFIGILAPLVMIVTGRASNIAEILRQINSIIAATSPENVLAFIIILLLSITILLLTPNAAKIIQSFMTGQPFQYGTAIGEAIYPGPVQTMAQARANRVEQRAKDPTVIPSIWERGERAIYQGLVLRGKLR